MRQLQSALKRAECAAQRKLTTALIPQVYFEQFVLLLRLLALPSTRIQTLLSKTQNPASIIPTE